MKWEEIRKQYPNAFVKFEVTLPEDLIPFLDFMYVLGE